MQSQYRALQSSASRGKTNEDYTQTISNENEGE